MEQAICVKRAAALINEFCKSKRRRFLIGVSGGPDSVALLHIILELKAQGQVEELYAAHLHHGIRQSADEDLAFVRNKCRYLGIALFEEQINVPELSVKTKTTLEAAARNARYSFLERARAASGASFILTAHHMGDQAETVLLHLLRGTGLSGLCGMRPATGVLLRPLLTTPKSELMEYLSLNNLAFRVDETNLEPCCMRNRIRLELLPLLEREYNPSIIKSICSMAELLAQDDAYLDLLAEKALEEAALSSCGYDRHKLSKLEKPLKSRAVRLALGKKGALYDLQRGGIESVCSLLNAKTGAVRALPRRMQARTSYEAIVLETLPKDNTEAFEEPFLFPGETVTPAGRFVASWADELKFCEGAAVAYIDADELSCFKALVLRRRMPGDRFHPLGAPGSRKLKAYLIDKKFPKAEREVPLLASGCEVLFFPGGTVSNNLRVRKTTKRILRVEFLKNEP